MAVPFAPLLRRLRLNAGLTQATLADKAGLSGRGIQRLEAGLGQPYADTTRRLADALGLQGENRSLFESTAQPAPRRSRARGQASGSTGGSHNLPLSLTSFIGRERESAQAEARLQTARLLTLVGGGGCGKTRLALEVARRVAARYRDGVWLLELAPLAEAVLVVYQLASVLSVRNGTEQPITSLIVETLRERQLLLVFDNASTYLWLAPGWQKRSCAPAQS